MRAAWMLLALLVALALTPQAEASRLGGHEPTACQIIEIRDDGSDPGGGVGGTILGIIEIHPECVGGGGGSDTVPIA